MRPSFNCEKGSGCDVFVHNPTAKLSPGGNFLFSFTLTSPSSFSPYFYFYPYSFSQPFRVLSFFSLHSSRHLCQLSTDTAYFETH